MGKVAELQKNLQFLLLVFLLALSSAATSSSSLLDQAAQSDETAKQHFVLVHGACLGSWSWYKVTTLLKSAGHNVTALDMAASGIDPKQAESLSSLTEYFQPLLSFLEALPWGEKIVLVGHSLGGLGISMAMEKFPEKISVAIFVTAAMPGPLFRFLTQEEQKKTLEMFSHFSEGDGSTLSANLFLFTESELATKLYPLSPPEDLTLAIALVRPQAMFGLIESMKELELTRERYGSVKRAFVISEEDEMTSKLMVLLMLTFNPPDLVAKIQGSDHMVMTSKPLDLSDQLQSIPQKLANVTSKPLDLSLNNQLWLATQLTV